ncbi:MAG: PHB depolymerase family esterase [Planctomycetota bacterium]|nr:PHB depolymerase family esterase [Planctomycetota bacterium]
MTMARSLWIVLLITFLFVPAGWAQDEADILKFRQAHQEGLNHLQSGQYTQAIESFKKAIEAIPEESSTYYNIACAYSLSGDVEQGVRWLEEAIRHGFDDAGHIRRDADLQNLRKHPRYQRIIKNLDRNPERGPYKVDFFRPKGFANGKKYPLLIALHNNGNNSTKFSNAWKDVTGAKGYVLASVQGRKKGHRGYGWNDDAEWDILRAVREGVQKHGVDSNRVYITGFSEGAILAYYVGLRHPEVFAGIIPVSGIFDPNVVLPMISTARGMGIFILQGARDPQTLSNARSAVKILQPNRNIELKYLEHPGGHAFPPNRAQVLSSILDWMNGLRVSGGRTGKPDAQKVWY